MCSDPVQRRKLDDGPRLAASWHAHDHTEKSVLSPFSRLGCSGAKGPWPVYTVEFEERPNRSQST